MEDDIVPVGNDEFPCVSFDTFSIRGKKNDRRDGRQHPHQYHACKHLRWNTFIIDYQTKGFSMIEKSVILHIF